MKNLILSAALAISSLVAPLTAHAAVVPNEVHAVQAAHVQPQAKNWYGHGEHRGFGRGERRADRGFDRGFVRHDYRMHERAGAHMVRGRGRR